MADWNTFAGGCFYNNIGGAEKVATIKCLEPLFATVVQALLALAGVAIFIMFLIGGFNFLFAGGDMKKLEKAKQTLTGAIIGLVIIVISLLIIRLIGEITGVSNLDVFKIIWN